MNTVRSTLSSFIIIEGFPAGSHPLVRRFLKGVFNLRPALPRHETVWDTSVVLKYLKKLSPAKKLDMKFLTLKLVTLLALLTGQRCQTLHVLNVSDIMLSKNHVRIKVKELLKHTRPGKHLNLLTIRGYAPDRRLCLITLMQEYLNRTQPLRTHDKLIQSFIRPHGPVTASTIGRWIKTVLLFSGVDTRVFSAHSTRGAASSKACLANVPLTTIMKTAGWSRSDTFSHYYDKPIVDYGAFGDSILKNT